MSEITNTIRPFRGEDLTGRIFGRWTVKQLLGRCKGGCRWICICQCGASGAIFGGHLRSGKSKSCGCLAKEITSHVKKTHGLTETPEYVAWGQCKRRCYCPQDKGYERYGGRGIVMCDEWRSSFSAFIRDMGRRPSALHSIDRIDNDGPYSKSNCRWATETQQARNKGNNVIVSFNGIEMPLTECLEITKRDYHRTYDRLRAGWSLERALNHPAR